MGRLFCPRCGNSALDKVQLVVGPDGSEQYGVKRKHILRGTRFSLPKPRVSGVVEVGAGLGAGLALQGAAALVAAATVAPRQCSLPLLRALCWLMFPLLATPQGGRHRDLILREDQLLAKAHRLRKKKEKAELDPFAPEYGEDTWHQVSSAATTAPSP